MKSELSQNLIVKYHYPHLQKVNAFANYYRELSPYTDPIAKNIRFFKIQPIQNSYHLSQESCSKTIKQYKQIYVHLKFIKIQRNFADTLFLVESNQNFVLLCNYIEMKKKCKEKIETVLILRLLKFLIQCRKYKQEEKINLANLVFTDSYEFRLYDIKLYAINPSQNNLSDEQIKKKRHKSSKNIYNHSDDFKDQESSLLKIFFQISKVNLIHQQSKFIVKHQNTQTLLLVDQNGNNSISGKLFKEQSIILGGQKQKIHFNPSIVLDNMKKCYPKKVAALIKQVFEKKQTQYSKVYQKILQGIQNYQKSDRNSSRILQIAQKDMSSTISSQSVCFQKDLQMYRKTSSVIIESQQNVPLISGQEKNRKFNLNMCNKKSFFIISIIICLTLIIGLGFFTYIRTEEAQQKCDKQSTYWNSQTHRCEDCFKSCQRCSGSEEYECISCKGKMFLVINNLQSMIGTCMNDCQGKIILKNKCLMSLKS